ncbi:MAG: AAA family ATPase [Alistipes putredinis]|nr:MAG: AAA family ATPase [Alistipes putredinis]
MPCRETTGRHYLPDSTTKCGSCRTKRHWQPTSTPDLFKTQTHAKQRLIYPFGSNASQLKAVQRAFEHSISVIQGPPGTGKTQTILNIIANILVAGKKLCWSSRTTTRQPIMCWKNSSNTSSVFLLRRLAIRTTNSALSKTKSAKSSIRKLLHLGMPPR